MPLFYFFRDCTFMDVTERPKFVLHLLSLLGTSRALAFYSLWFFIKLRAAENTKV